MSSGLRQLARLAASPFLTLGRNYNEIAKRRPLATGIWTTVFKTSAADIFAQKVVEQREEVDWKRNGLFTFFGQTKDGLVVIVLFLAGFAYLGGFQYWLYNRAFVKICKPITAVVGHYGSAPVKTFIDQCIHHPLFYFPCFYILKGAVEGRSVDSSLTKYQQDLWENCKALWMVWVPAQMVNFTVVPLHLRVPFVAGISFAWTVIISVMRGSLEGAESADDPAEVPVKEPITHAPIDGEPAHAPPLTLPTATMVVSPPSVAVLSVGPAAGLMAATAVAQVQAE